MPQLRGNTPCWRGTILQHVVYVLSHRPLWCCITSRKDKWVWKPKGVNRSAPLVDFCASCFYKSDLCKVEDPGPQWRLLSGNKARFPLNYKLQLCPGSSRQGESHHTDMGNWLLVWVLWEADTKMGLNVEGFYWSKSLGKKVNHVRLGEWSDCEANLTLDKLEGTKFGWDSPRQLCSPRKFQQGHWRALDPKSAIRGVPRLPGRAHRIVTAVLGHWAEQPVGSTAWFQSQQPRPSDSYTPCSWSSATCILMVPTLTSQQADFAQEGKEQYISNLIVLPCLIITVNVWICVYTYISV